jgi:pimeloyl-ACP methyl ester carboxylesterase
MKIILTRKTFLAVAICWTATAATAQVTIQASTSPDDPFYDVSNVKATELTPGSLVRTAGYSTSRLRNSTNSKIMYISIDGNGASVAATAAVSVPEGTPPAGGWPVIAWAHGTVGVGRLCAPSMTADLSKYLPTIQIMLQHGYAVVAPDYSGLGTTGRHFYSHRISNARDVIESVRAATTAYPELSKKFIVVGHSQGGLAALGVAETIKGLSIAPLQYKGAIAIAPGLGVVQDYFRSTSKYGSSTPITLTYMLYYSATMKLLDPGSAYSDIVTPMAEAKMPLAEELCLTELRASLAAEGTTYPFDNVKYSFAYSRKLSAYADINKVGQVKAEGPLLLLVGTLDTTPTVDALAGFARSSCKLGSNIIMKTYAGATHITVTAAARADIYSWLENKFSDIEIPTTCNN